MSVSGGTVLKAILNTGCAIHPAGREFQANPAFRLWRYSQLATAPSEPRSPACPVLQPAPLRGAFLHPVTTVIRLADDAAHQITC